MQKASIILGIVLAIVVSFISVPSAVPATVELTISRQLDLQAPTSDVCTSADGKWLYILSAGQVAVYSFADDRIVNHVAIDKAFDSMMYVKEKNSIVITSRSDNQLQIVQLAEVYQFDNSGLPYQGSKRAPVTMVVFSDYQ